MVVLFIKILDTETLSLTNIFLRLCLIKNREMIFRMLESFSSAYFLTSANNDIFRKGILKYHNGGE